MSRTVPHSNLHSFAGEKRLLFSLSQVKSKVPHPSDSENHARGDNNLRFPPTLTHQIDRSWETLRECERVLLADCVDLPAARPPAKCMKMAEFAVKGCHIDIIPLLENSTHQNRLQPRQLRQKQ